MEHHIQEEHGGAGHYTSALETSASKGGAGQIYGGKGRK